MDSMAKQKLFFFFTFLVVSLQSCINDQEMSIVPQGAKDIHVEILQDSVIRLSEFCSYVEYIPLESTQESCIGELSRIAITNHGDILAFNDNTPSILRFDKDGRFMNLIGRMGRQEGELSNHTNAVYDKYLDCVIVWDYNNRKIKYYSLDGKFLNSIDVDWFRGVFSVLDNDNLVLYADVSEKMSVSEYEFLIVSKDSCKVINQFQDPDRGFQFSKGFIRPDLDCVNDTLYYKSMYSNTVFEVGIDGLAPKYHVSYRKPVVKQSWFERGYQSLSRKINSNPDIAFCCNFGITEHHYVISTVHGNKLYLNLVNQNRPTSLKCGRPVVIDMYDDAVFTNMECCTLNYFKPVLTSGNECYFVIIPGFVSVEDCKAPSETIPEEYFRMLENENPVIIKCTLK